jgi:tRNA (cmo5U34)-methyltransferase
MVDPGHHHLAPPAALRSTSSTTEASLRTRRDTIWRQPIVVHAYLTGLRAAVPAAAEQIDVMLRLVAATDRPIRRVLDLGSGDGPLTAALLARYPAADAILVDFSAPMLAAAAARFAGRTPPPRLVDADLSEPTWRAPLAPVPFDAVVSGFAIHHLLDDRKRALYGEVFALLAPGGIFVNIEHVASPTRWLEHRFDDLMVDVLTAAAPRSAADRSRETIAAEYHARPDKAANLLAPVEAQCSWLRTIGFADVDCWHKCFELAVFGGRKPPTTQDERDG